MSWFSDGLDWIGNQVDSGSSWGTDIGNWFTGSSPIGQGADGSALYPEGGSASSGSWFDRNVWNGGISASDNWRDILNRGRQGFNAINAANNRSGTRSDILNAYRAMAEQDQAYNAEYYKWAQQQQAANAAASAANDRARRKAAAEAMAIEKQALEGLQQQYAPFTKTMTSLLPKMQKDYSKYLDSTSLLNQYLTPLVMKDLGKAPAPAYSMDIPQSAYSVSMPQAQGSVEFPSLEKLLSGRK